MSPQLTECEAQALKLPPTDRHTCAPLSCALVILVVTLFSNKLLSPLPPPCPLWLADFFCCSRSHGAHKEKLRALVPQ